MFLKSAACKVQLHRSISMFLSIIKNLSHYSSVIVAALHVASAASVPNASKQMHLHFDANKVQVVSITSILFLQNGISIQFTRPKSGAPIDITSVGTLGLPSGPYLQELKSLARITVTYHSSEKAWWRHWFLNELCENAPLRLF